MTDIMEARRKGFEAWAVARRDDNGLPHFVFAMKEGRYVDRGAEIAWEAWNAALDSVCVELPQQHEQPFRDFFGRGINYGIQMCIESIERAGLKVKP